MSKAFSAWGENKIKPKKETEKEILDDKLLSSCINKI